MITAEECVVENSSAGSLEEDTTVSGKWGPVSCDEEAVRPVSENMKVAPPVQGRGKLCGGLASPLHCAFPLSSVIKRINVVLSEDKCLGLHSECREAYPVSASQEEEYVSFDLLTNTLQLARETRIYGKVHRWRHGYSTIRYNSWWNSFICGLALAPPCLIITVVVRSLEPVVCLVEWINVFNMYPKVISMNEFRYSYTIIQYISSLKFTKLSTNSKVIITANHTEIWTIVTSIFIFLSGSGAS